MGAFLDRRAKFKDKSSFTLHQYPIEDLLEYIPCHNSVNEEITSSNILEGVGITQDIYYSKLGESWQFKDKCLESIPEVYDYNTKQAFTFIDSNYSNKNQQRMSFCFDINRKWMKALQCPSPISITTQFILYPGLNSIDKVIDIFAIGGYSQIYSRFKSVGNALVYSSSSGTSGSKYSGTLSFSTKDHQQGLIVQLVLTKTSCNTVNKSVTNIPLEEVKNTSLYEVFDSLGMKSSFSMAYSGNKLQARLIIRDMSTGSTIAETATDCTYYLALFWYSQFDDGSYLYEHDDITIFPQGVEGSIAHCQITPLLYSSSNLYPLTPSESYISDFVAYKRLLSSDELADLADCARKSCLYNAENQAYINSRVTFRFKSTSTNLSSASFDVRSNGGEAGMQVSTAGSASWILQTNSHDFDDKGPYFFAPKDFHMPSAGKYIPGWYELYYSGSYVFGYYVPGYILAVLSIPESEANSTYWHPIVGWGVNENNYAYSTAERLKYCALAFCKGQFYWNAGAPNGKSDFRPLTDTILKSSDYGKPFLLSFLYDNPNITQTRWYNGETWDNPTTDPLNASIRDISPKVDIIGLSVKPNQQSIPFYIGLSTVYHWCWGSITYDKLLIWDVNAWANTGTVSSGKVPEFNLNMEQYYEVYDKLCEIYKIDTEYTI